MEIVPLVPRPPPGGKANIREKLRRIAAPQEGKLIVPGKPNIFVGPIQCALRRTATSSTRGTPGAAQHPNPGLAHLVETAPNRASPDFLGLVHFVEETEKTSGMDFIGVPQEQHIRVKPGHVFVRNLKNVHGAAAAAQMPEREYLFHVRHKPRRSRPSIGLEPRATISQSGLQLLQGGEVGSHTTIGQHGVVRQEIGRKFGQGGLCLLVGDRRRVLIFLFRVYRGLPVAGVSVNEIEIRGNVVGSEMRIKGAREPPAPRRFRGVQGNDERHSTTLVVVVSCTMTRRCWLCT